MSSRPKYSLIEFERRWLVNKDLLPDISNLEKIIISDKYFPDTRMRLREMINTSDKSTVYKLTKKYGKISESSEPLTTIYLSKEEFNLFNKQNGYSLKKTIYRYPYCGHIFLIEFFQYPETDFILSESEASSEEELAVLKIPEFIEREVTTEKEFEGYTIASDPDSYKNI